MAWCSVCDRDDREEIDLDLLDPRNSLTRLAAKHKISWPTLKNHRNAHLATKVTKALTKAVAVKDDSELGNVSGEIAELKRKATELGALAEKEKKLSTALLAVRELTRLVELQARLVLEARASDARDVARSPAFLAVASDILASLSSCDECTRRVHERIKLRLGVPIEVHLEQAKGTALADPVDAGEGVPFPEA